jgi:hypothetical protein
MEDARRLARGLPGSNRALTFGSLLMSDAFSKSPKITPDSR